MNTLRFLRRPHRGFALLTVLMLIGIMAILTVAILSYSGTERRLNERNRLLLRARNMAENVALYASEQVTTKLYRLRSMAPMAFMSGKNQIYLPPDPILTTAYSTPTDVEVRAGLTSSTGLAYIDPTLAINASNPNAGLSVNTSSVPIISKATMHHPALGAVTAYAEQDLQIALIPLFQFAVFYNMDMEYGPGPTMVISGPVHTNGNLIARIQTGFANTLQFTERVTAAGGFYANTAYKGKTYMGDGTVDAGPGGTGPLDFQNPAGTVTNIMSSSNVWRDHLYGAASESATTDTQFRTFATSTYGGNLRTSVHGVTPVSPPAVTAYSPTASAADNAAALASGRQLIQVASTLDSADLQSEKLARLCGLYVIVNPDDTTRNGTLPDASTVPMRARSYRCWLNTVNTDGTYTLQEVILPGQPSYGALNANRNLLPNAYRIDTAAGRNQVLRTVQGGAPDLADTGYRGPAIPALTSFPTYADSYFYDLRRGNGSNSYPFNRSASNWVPRPIAKIDFDMTRFKMAVSRTFAAAATSSVYSPARPNGDNWASSVLNPAGVPATVGLGLGAAYSTLGGLDVLDNLEWSQAGIYAPAKLAIGAMTQAGTGTPAAYTGRFTIEDTYSASPTSGTAIWVNRYTSLADEASPATPYVPAAGVTGIRVRLYLAGGITTKLDEQILLPTTDTAVAPVVVACSSDYAFTTGRFTIEETTTAQSSSGGTSPMTTSTWTLKYTSSADETTHTYTPSSAAVTGLRVTQFQPGGTSSQLRQQVIPVVIATLTNDFHVIPATSNTSGFLFANAVTEMHVYVGGLDDSEDWTFSVVGTPTAGLAGGFGNDSTHLAASRTAADCAGFNRYWVTGMSSTDSPSTNTGTITLRATKGTTTIDRVFTVEKQGYVAARAAPSQTGRWLTISSGIAPDPFQIYFAPSDPTDPRILTNPAAFKVGPGDLVNTGAPCPWFDGITVYVDSVDAEVKTATGGVPDRVDSGVRLWNGRGSLISLDGTTYPGRTGFTFVTNDAVYIVGHYNADGVINPTQTSTGVGGYSGRYPESAAEMLCAVMGDAVTILSQPAYVKSGSVYYQSTGWADSLSPERRGSSGWSSSWQTSNPSGSNSVDGTSASITPPSMPDFTDYVYSPGAGSSATVKLAPTVTEISTCLLTGIVQTSSGQTSGGVHNFPRLLEQWDGTGLYIRGSMVAMFASQVATEPWSIRCYTGAGRYWGLHDRLRAQNGTHDLPLEPVVLNAQRVRFHELSATDYATQKAVIEALPH